MTGKLKRDLPHVMHETIDNEVVVVNLTTGVYYSFDGVAVRIWDWIDGHRSLENIVDLATECFDGAAEVIAPQVQGFLDRLLEEELVAIEPGTQGEKNSDDSIAPKSLPFTEPSFQKYTDMEALLLADPIHEVDESAGWPHKK